MHFFLKSPEFVYNKKVEGCTNVSLFVVLKDKTKQNKIFRVQAIHNFFTPNRFNK